MHFLWHHNGKVLYKVLDKGPSFTHSLIHSRTNLGFDVF